MLFLTKYRLSLIYKLHWSAYVPPALSNNGFQNLFTLMKVTQAIFWPMTIFVQTSEYQPTNRPTNHTLTSLQDFWPTSLLDWAVLIGGIHVLLDWTSINFNKNIILFGSLERLQRALWLKSVKPHLCHCSTMTHVEHCLFNSFIWDPLGEMWVVCG